MFRKKSQYFTCRPDQYLISDDAAVEKYWECIYAGLLPTSISHRKSCFLVCGHTPCLRILALLANSICWLGCGRKIAAFACDISQLIFMNRVCKTEHVLLCSMGHLAYECSLSMLLVKFVLYTSTRICEWFSCHIVQ